uniref:Uncharacterized protein n=1 Tax=Fibrocapsa japonica TaxID=94617 RepID=A0A7S2V388_9STRA
MESPNTSLPNNTLVIFDYDHTITECDSGIQMINMLNPDLACNFKMYKEQGFGWTEIMDRQMCSLWEQGVKPTEILQSASSVVWGEGSEEAIKLISSREGCEVYILSDANTVFIRQVLETRGLAAPVVSRVVSNPGFWTAEGRLRITPHHAPPPAQGTTYFGTNTAAYVPDGDSWVGVMKNRSDHGCPEPLCPYNLCKGKVVDEMLEELREQGKEFGRIIYVGDGGGDYCASTRLRENDVVLARIKEDGTPYPMYAKIQESRQAELEGRKDISVVRASVHTWKTQMDVLDVIRNVLGPDHKD